MQAPPKRAGDQPKPRRLEAAATVLAGGIEGGLTLLAAQPLQGAIIGAGVASLSLVLQHVASDMGQRMLSPREDLRIGEAMVSAVRKARENNEHGFHLRNDDFFASSPGERPPAEEITEAVFLAIQREVQERKIPSESYLLVNIAYRPNVTPHMAHRLVRLIAELSYSQLSVLAVLGERPTWSLQSHRIDRPIDNPTLADVHDLVFRGVVTPSGITERNGGPFMSEISVGPVGSGLIELAELTRLPILDIDRARTALAALVRES